MMGKDGRCSKCFGYMQSIRELPENTTSFEVRTTEDGVRILLYTAGEGIDAEYSFCFAGDSVVLRV